MVGQKATVTLKDTSVLCGGWGGCVRGRVTSSPFCPHSSSWGPQSYTEITPVVDLGDLRVIL